MARRFSEDDVVFLIRDSDVQLGRVSWVESARRIKVNYSVNATVVGLNLELSYDRSRHRFGSVGQPELDDPVLQVASLHLRARVLENRGIKDLHPGTRAWIFNPTWVLSLQEGWDMLHYEPLRGSPEQNAAYRRLMQNIRNSLSERVPMASIR